MTETTTMAMSQDQAFQEANRLLGQLIAAMDAIVFEPGRRADGSIDPIRASQNADFLLRAMTANLVAGADALRGLR